MISYDVAGTTSTYWRRRDGKGRGEHNRAGSGRGMSGPFGWRELRRAEENRDVNGGQREGRQVVWGLVMWKLLQAYDINIHTTG